MAAEDTFEESFLDRAHIHTGAGAETVLTIGTVIDRHYALALVVRVQGDAGSGQRQSFQRGMQIINDGGTVQVDLSAATDEDNDPNTSGYALSATVSGSDVLVQVAAATDARSAARAVGLSFEHQVSGA